MPTNAKMLIFLRADADNAFLKNLREDFKEAMRLSDDDFYSGGPFVLLGEAHHQYMPVTKEKGHWLDLNLWRSYFGEGYERGDGGLFIKSAEWIELKIPGCEIYYGHDVNDENIGLFDSAARERLQKLISRSNRFK